MLFKKKNQLEKITQDFHNLPMNMKDYEKQEKIAMHKHATSLMLAWGSGAFLLFFLCFFVALGGSFLLSVMPPTVVFMLGVYLVAYSAYWSPLYWSPLKLSDFIFDNKFLNTFEIKTIEQDNTITIQLVKSCVNKFSKGDIDYYKTDNVLQNYLLDAKAHDERLIAKYDHQILEEQIFDKKHDVEALEYAAELKIKAEELNQQTVEETKQKLSSAIEQAQIEGLPEVETFSQDIKLLHQSIKQLITS